jgi:hypothetical protein
MPGEVGSIQDLTSTGNPSDRLATRSSIWLWIGVMKALHRNVERELNPYEGLAYEML